MQVHHLSCSSSDDFEADFQEFKDESDVDEDNEMVGSKPSSARNSTAAKSVEFKGQADKIPCCTIPIAFIYFYFLFLWCVKHQKPFFFNLFFKMVLMHRSSFVFFFFCYMVLCTIGLL